MNYNATSSWKSQTYPGTTPCSRKRTFVFVLSLSQSLCFTFSPLTVCPVLVLGSWPLLSISSVPVSTPTTGQAGAGLVRGHRGEGEAGLRGLHRVLLTQAPCHQYNETRSNPMARARTRRQPSPFTEATEPRVHQQCIALMFNLTTNLLCHK